MLYFIYTDLISSLLDPRLVDPGLTFDLRRCILSQKLLMHVTQFKMPKHFFRLVILQISTSYLLHGSTMFILFCKVREAKKN